MCEQYHAFQEVIQYLEDLPLLSLPNSFMTILRPALDQNLVNVNLSAHKGLEINTSVMQTSYLTC